MKQLTCARLAKTGKRVNPLERSPDAEFILEGDESDYDWYEVQVSPEQFFSYWNSKIPDEDDRKRMRTILNHWRSTPGGPVAGLNAYPILAFLEKTPPAWPGGVVTQLKLLDGWHRLEAYKATGATSTVTALVSCPPKGHTLE